MKEITISIPDMTCASCASTLTSALADYASVEVNVSVPMKQVVVNYDESEITDQQILKTFASAGFDGEIIDEN